MPKKTDIPGIVAHIKVGPMHKGVKPVSREVVIGFGNRAVREFITDATFNVRSADVAAFLRTLLPKLTGVTKVTRKQVARLLERGIESGDTTNTMAKNLRGLFDDISKGRALTIVRTEVARASNYGVLEGYKQASVDGKQWLSTQDALVRAEHQELEGDIVGIDEEFEVAGYTAQYPGDFGAPEMDVNCRCGILPVINGKRLRGARWMIWRSLETERAPWDRKMLRVVRKALVIQRDATLSALAAA